MHHVRRSFILFSKMTITRSPINSNMQRPRGPGWAAFGRKQQEKQGTGPECDVVSYPPISEITSSGPTKSLTTNHCAPIRSFSSVVSPSIEFPRLVGNRKSGIINDNSGVMYQDDQIVTEPSVTPPVKMLKDIHLWADQNLIEDILAAVSNDVDQASVLLKAMVSPDSKLEETSISGPSSSTVSYPCEDKNKSLEESTSVENKLSDGAHEVLVSKRLFSVPVEPEWEEDDVYLSRRKDAMRMMRAASQHSRAASNAFLRGDHFSAQQYSLRAHGERMAAEKLNNKAAKEILRIRNRNNDIWKIDLHGLHASEAVSALKEHLHEIESQIVMNRSASSDGLAKLEAGISRSPSCEGVNELEINNESKKKKELPQKRQTVLHVITGKGNHSRGEVALPTVVKSFLIENGYRFDDARAGVFAVRPKFRTSES